jgi:hypothetical protein
VLKRVQRVTVGLSGLMAAVLLHSLLFIAAVWGDGTTVQKVRLPDAFGAGANAGSSGGEASDRLIIIQLPTDVARELPAMTEAPALAELIERPPSLLEITGPDSLPLKPLFPSEEGEEATASEADLIARTKLVGLYEGQIRARIERAWAMPREQSHETGFSCRVKIRQSSTGYIEEIELQRCDDSPVWQRSLTNAIFAASPLPAPPNPAVFADVFSLVFRAPAVGE